jgi:hypothetical protein
LLGETKIDSPNAGMMVGLLAVSMGLWRQTGYAVEIAQGVMFP